MGIPRLLIAPDKFKGSLTSFQVADAIEKGIRKISKKISIEKIPLADGGDGFVPVVTKALGGRLLKAKKIPDALGRPRVVEYGWVNHSHTAVLDVAGVCGIASLKTHERNALKTSSYGLGVMIGKMIKEGAKEILVGLGGSATNDGGIGCATALGYQFKDKKGKPLFPCGENLEQIATIQKNTKLKLCRIRVAIDVTNPLLGKNGATYVFGPQKGANSRALKKLEKGMKNLAQLAGRQPAKTKGTGAAGGLGYGLMVFANAKLENGFGLIAGLTKLENKIRQSDILITGEGCLDTQTATGKVPEGVRRLARAHHKRVIAFVGTTKGNVKGRYDQIFALTDVAKNSQESIRKAYPLLVHLASRQASQFLGDNH